MQTVLHNVLERVYTVDYCTERSTLWTTVIATQSQRGVYAVTAKSGGDCRERSEFPVMLRDLLSG
jgi:hypothetical protein